MQQINLALTKCDLPITQHAHEYEREWRIKNNFSGGEAAKYPPIFAHLPASYFLFKIENVNFTKSQSTLNIVKVKFLDVVLVSPQRGIVAHECCQKY